MPWLQLRVDTNRDDAARIEAAMLFAGAVSVTLQDNADQPVLEPALGETPLWDATRVTGLFDADIDTRVTEARAASHLCEPLPNARWEQLEDKDWEREWMEHYHPIQCGERLWVCPSWREPPEADGVNLMLDPGLAFGTGTHPTTFLCLGWLDGAPLAGKTVLDYGCGSGILGIAALLLGAERAAGTDIDPQALLASRENLRRNGLAEDRFPVYLPQDLPQAENDIVVANILAGPLVELAPDLIRQLKPGGRLCLSGILQSQAEAVKSAYRNWIDFDPDGVREEWVRLSGVRAR
ncbi:50S ribosomal protein L11 methyltransferase [Biformimicrobium ophioploci]|uniref:Ribosomal protein L11 methyltransferase n=1 Tax=Biformimicrobium ophioploci TaxID=3036711 RepID=A0ABQ6LUG7_9GAMM|nr:50S ribosomal protein L11 methyltransferase [Microbulbifer sp. NKW57]GMG85709.1 50S ribosomal protein L11 methyltransferase [Microbulbifer sp. NKW57]